MATNSAGDTLARLRQLLKTQDNRATAWPVYVVEQKRRIYGLDPDAVDDAAVWLHQDGDEADATEAKELQAEYDRTLEEPECWRRTAFVDVWEFVTACFTEEAANAYITANRHNLQEPRVFVHSAYRNYEWQSVVKALSSAPAPAAETAKVVDAFRREVQDKLGVAFHHGSASRGIPKGTILDQCEDFLVEQFTAALQAPPAPAAPEALSGTLRHRWENQIAKGGAYVSVRREDAIEVLALLASPEGREP